MELKQHQEEVKKLNELESKLQSLILNKNDSELNTVFFKWQDQRKFCNEGFVKVCDKILKAEHHDL